MKPIVIEPSKPDRLTDLVYPHHQSNPAQSVSRISLGNRKEKIGLVPFSFPKKEKVCPPRRLESADPQPI